MNPEARAARLVRRGGLFTRERLFLFGDHRALGRHFGVELDEGLLIFGHVVLMEDGLDGAFGHASFAVDALVGVNVEDLFAFVKALDGADDNAIGVLAAEARLANNVGHVEITPRAEQKVCDLAKVSEFVRRAILRIVWIGWIF
jgi:hypothetical protein